MEDRSTATGWGPRVYGDPCGECGFDWGIGRPNAQSLVAGAPARLRALLAGAGGGERHPDLGWPVVGYVCHIGDNLRIFAERIAGISLGGSSVVAGYDENALAAVRGYESASLPAALWSLERAVGEWVGALVIAPANLTMIHPERGEIDLDDVVLSNAHDCSHHEWDIARSLDR